MPSPSNPALLEGGVTSIPFEVALAELRRFYLEERTGTLLFTFKRGDNRAMTPAITHLPDEYVED